MAATRLAESLYFDPAASRDAMLEAEALLADAHTEERRRLGPTHPDTLNTAAQRANLQRRLAELEP